MSEYKNSEEYKNGEKIIREYNEGLKRGPVTIDGTALSKIHGKPIGKDKYRVTHMELREGVNLGMCRHTNRIVGSDRTCPQFKRRRRIVLRT